MRQKSERRLAKSVRKKSKDQPSEMHKIKDFSDEFGGGDTERLFLESRVFFRGFELETA